MTILKDFKILKKKILYLTEDIKYKEDIKMQGLIRKKFLDDTYGSDNVNEIMGVLGFDTDLLGTDTGFNAVLSKFETRY